MSDTEPTVAVLILTLNEADTLPVSLGSVRRELGDVAVLVLDSISTDNTVNVAASMGARVESHPFIGYASQRRLGLEFLSGYDWVLMLDADEEISPEFAREMRRFVKTAPKTTDMALFRRKDYYLGKWIRRSSGYPTWFGRLVRPTKVRVEREINEEYNCSGNIGYLEAHLNHYPFYKGLEHWVEKHNRYSTCEAKLLIEAPLPKLHKSDLVSRNKSERRRFFKSVFMTLPFRPLSAFLYLYIYRMGFLDGRAGFQICTMRFIYECLINLKRDELGNRAETATQ